jgi:hypothetical protein
VFNNLFLKILIFCDNVEKYGTARQGKNDNIIRRMRFACRITKATDTHSEYLILIVFHGYSGYANAHQCYVMRTLPVLLRTELNEFRHLSEVRISCHCNTEASFVV